MATKPAVGFIGSSASSQSNVSMITLQVGGGITRVRIERIKIQRTAGSGANFTPRIYSSSSGTAGTISQEYQGAATAVGTLFDATAVDVYCQTDTAGKLYLQPGFDVGADNACQFHIWWEALN